MEDDVLFVDKEEFKTVSDILKAVNFFHGINISSKEVYPKRVSKTFKDGAVELELTINTKKSALYKGSFKVKVNYEPLSKRIPILILDGFSTPVKEM